MMIINKIRNKLLDSVAKAVCVWLRSVINI